MNVLLPLILTAILGQEPAPEAAAALGEPVESSVAAEIGKFVSEEEADEAIRLAQAAGPAAQPGTPAGRRFTGPSGAPALRSRAGAPTTAPGGTALGNPNLFAQTEGTAPNNLTMGSRGGIPQMIGDMSPLGILVPAAATGLPQPFPPNPPPKPPNPRIASALVPSVRGFKIGENQSPQPQDRLFFSSNYFSNVNATVNRQLGASVDDLKVYRQIFGFEKTFNESQGSIGLRLPLNTLYGASNIQGKFAKPGGTSTALGNLSIFTKYILMQDRATGSLVSAGFVVTPPTGSNTFANAKFIQGLNTTSFQPFLGYIYNQGDFYIHGFTAIDAPVNPNDAMLLYQDIGFGYFLLRSEAGSDEFLTAVAPTFEIHCNIPLNHRDPFSKTDISGTADVVNLTYGLNMEFRHTSVLTVGFVNPVTSPKPFDFEVLVLFNWRFGQSRVRPQNLPILGG